MERDRVRPSQGHQDAAHSHLEARHPHVQQVRPGRRNQRFSDLVFIVERKFSVYITYNDLLSANMDILTPGAINNCINNNIYDNNRDVVLYTST